jgi:hypothetical protein
MKGTRKMRPQNICLIFTNENKVHLQTDHTTGQMSRQAIVRVDQQDKTVTHKASKGRAILFNVKTDALHIYID